MAQRNFFQRGALKAAIEQEREEQRAIVLSGDVDRVEANNVRELAEKLLERSLRTLETDLKHDEPRIRSDAARAIGAIGVMLLKQEKEAEAPPSPEERAARLAAAEASPDVRAYLIARGWKEPDSNG